MADVNEMMNKIKDKYKDEEEIKDTRKGFVGDQSDGTTVEEEQPKPTIENESVQATKEELDVECDCDSIYMKNINIEFCDNGFILSLFNDDFNCIEKTIHKKGSDVIKAVKEIFKELGC